ncbi:MAG: DUF4215 domain-containing protein [Candidatus Binatia bacterium]
MHKHLALAVVVVGALAGGQRARAATTELISGAIGGVPADGETFTATMTPDGNFVAFSSAANNLVADDTNQCDIVGNPDLENCTDIFVRDRATATTTRVSVDSSGVEANGPSNNPDISSDGQWVAFESLASNLVPGDTNDLLDCFLHDRVTGATERVSITDAEGEASGRNCRVSDDGRYVVFSSRSDALTSLDDSYEDVFIRDRVAGTTKWISYWANFFGDNECDTGDNLSPSISSDGRYVMFLHDEAFSCDEDTRLEYLIIYDRENNAWERASLSPTQLSNVGPLDFARYYTYRLSSGGNPIRVYLRDRELGKTEDVSISTDGAHGNDTSSGGRVTEDGRFVAFTSRASNLVPDDTNPCEFGSCRDVFVRDRDAKTTTRVSLTATGGEGDGDSISLGIASGGVTVLFVSKATNLVPGDTNGVQDAFVRVSLCGDGVVDLGEECDDGNLTDGDGCSATCLLDCPPTPRIGCVPPSQLGKATVKLAARTPSTKNQLQWKWQPGPATSKAAFGQPTTTVGYRLCLYHDSGLAMTVGIPAGSGWKEGSKSFAYKRKSGAPDGVVGVQLKTSVVDGKAKIQVKGKGALLPMPALVSLLSPVTVQLSNTLPVPGCWEAVFSEPFQRQDAGQFKDNN